mmetsp:Transcript_8365/g.20128  ORF Transcript_8365/g.20128 Transcript_8365/m.20128 type:complete len:164 (-) Transcript_8365:134-625(-)
MPSNELLLREKDILDKLYDAESMMEIEKSVAQGYITLLGGNCADADPALSFLALTQGNVIDACFGVSSASISRGEVTPNMQSARTAKALLDECALNSTREQFQQLAVTSYKNAFEEVVAHNQRRSKLNCITRCCRPKKVRKKAEQQLKAAFLELAKAVGECSS